MAAYRKDTRKKVPEELQAAFAAEADDAAQFMDESFTGIQVLMTDYYRGDLPGISEQDFKDNRSDIVSRDVHDAVQAILPDMMRVFLGGENIVEFRPVGKEDEAHAQQATEAIRHIFEKDNDAYALIHGALKDGLVRSYAVAAWWHETKERDYEQEYTGLSLDQIADLTSEPGTAIIDLETPTEDEEPEQEPGAAPPPATPPGQLPDGSPDPSAGLHDLTLRHKRTEQRICVELVPPEEVLVSRKARQFNGRQFVGRRQNLTVAELEAMGYELEDHEMPSADGQLQTHELEQARNPNTGAGTARSDEGARLVAYTEGYITWADKDDEAPRLYKVCSVGGAHRVVAAEPVDSVDMALWTPDPEPHTVIGESDAGKVADIQRMKTEMWRGVLDSLAEALVPRTEVVEGQVNMKDALSNEIGALVRVRQPGMVRPLSTPFVGQQAIPLFELVDAMREERVGAFRAADGLSAEAMQSSTKMAVAATISGSKARKELLARGFAAQFLAPIFRGILRLFVQNQDKPRWMRMRGEWVEVDPRGWNADMDCDIDVAMAMATTDERLKIFDAVAEKQELILQQFGPQNPICSLGEYSNTLRKLSTLAGIRNVDAYFKTVPPDWQPPQPEAPPDPALIVAQAQAQALGQEQARKNAESQREQARKDRELVVNTDIARDKQASEDKRGWAELNLKYQADTTLQAAELAEEQRKNDLNFGLKAAQAEQAAQAPPAAPTNGQGGPAQ